MKVLVVGGKGLLGTNIAPYFRERFDLVIADVDTWDITDRAAGEAELEKHDPDVVVNLAAITDVDGCEDDKRELAELVNGIAPGIVADVCNKRGVRFVHFSTDYVFDGTKKLPYKEDDATHPLSVYGATKLAGEKSALEKNPSTLIIRGQWLYGVGGQHFVTKVVSRAKQTGALHIVNDQRGSPTFTRDLAEPMAALIEKEKSGIFHLANSGSCTWFDFAEEIFSLLNIDVALTPVPSSEFPTKAARPAYSVFDMWKFQKATGLKMRPWKEALKSYINEAKISL